MGHCTVHLVRLFAALCLDRFLAKLLSAPSAPCEQSRAGEFGLMGSKLLTCTLGADAKGSTEVKTLRQGSSSRLKPD